MRDAHLLTWSTHLSFKAEVILVTGANDGLAGRTRAGGPRRASRVMGRIEDPARLDLIRRSYPPGEAGWRRGASWRANLCCGRRRG